MRALLEQITVARRLGTDTAPATRVLVDAALDWHGHRPDTLSARLGSAHAAFEREISQRLEERLAHLRRRSDALRESGVDVSRLLPAATGPAGPRRLPRRLDELEGAEAKVGRVEADWQEIGTVFSHVALERASATEYGWTVSGIPDRVTDCQDRLRRGTVLPSELASLLDEARAEERALAAVLAPSIVEALERTAKESGPGSADPIGAARVRAFREAAGRALLAQDAVGALRLLGELRSAVAYETAGATEETTGSRGRPEAPDDGPTVEAILERADRLSARLRRLPSDSSIARTVAEGLRRATDLLRAGKLSEADASLTHLMDQLPEDPDTGE